MKHSGEYDGQIRITARIKLVKRLLLRLGQWFGSRRRWQRDLFVCENIASRRKNL